MQSCFSFSLNIYPSYHQFHLDESRWCDVRKYFFFHVPAEISDLVKEEKLLVLLTFCPSLGSFLQQPAHMKCSSGQIFSNQTLMDFVYLMEKHVFSSAHGQIQHFYLFVITRCKHNKIYMCFFDVGGGLI